MTTQELEVELANIKDRLAELQATVTRLSVLLDNKPTHLVKGAPKTEWLALAGVGAEVWRGVDVDAYLDEERNAWN